MWEIKRFKLLGSVYNYVLLLLSLVSGGLFHKDYGMCWGELMQYNFNEKVLYNFVLKGDEHNYLESAEKYHEGNLEFLLYTISRIFSPPIEGQ